MGQQHDKQCRDCALQNRFTAYLQAALRRKKCEYIQKQNRIKGREILTDFQVTELADSSECGVNWGLSFEDFTLSQALDGLTAKERFILFECILNGKRYKELAEALNLRYNGAASAYRRVIKKLCKELQGGIK